MHEASAICVCLEVKKHLTDAGAPAEQDLSTVCTCLAGSGGVCTRDCAKQARAKGKEGWRVGIGVECKLIYHLRLTVVVVEVLVVMVSEDAK